MTGRSGNITWGWERSSRSIKQGSDCEEKVRRHCSWNWLQSVWVLVRPSRYRSLVNQNNKFVLICISQVDSVHVGGLSKPKPLRWSSSFLLCREQLHVAPVTSSKVEHLECDFPITSIYNPNPIDVLAPDGTLDHDNDETAASTQGRKTQSQEHTSRQKDNTAHKVRNACSCKTLLF